jgi:uncharacterized protein
MSGPPIFPVFKPIELQDRGLIAPILQRYQPETSEWTFTNLFIWRDHYGFEWSLYKDWLFVVAQRNGDRAVYAMEPLGPPGRREAVLTLLRWLKEGAKEGRTTPSIERADKRLADELPGATDLIIEPTRDHFDYVYLRDDLVQLAGNKYRTKRNHINRLSRNYAYTFAPLEEKHIDACMELQSRWCEIRRCEEDLSLLGEWEAIRETLMNFPSLELSGGVVTIDDKVQAFTVGELLREGTAVIHIEKANPEIGELYSLVNQQCAEKCWGNVLYINREQDLGLPGLREAKLSYHPHHMVDKYRITLVDP